MVRKILIACITGLALVLISCNKDKDNSIFPTNEDEFEGFLGEEMRDQHMQAVAVLLFHGTTLQYERYFGQADLENNRLLDASYLFLLASVSKTVTTTALMQLYEQDSFELDDPINDYLSFDVRHPDSDVSITFRHLLTHTSGIADGSALDDQYYYGEDSPVDLKQFMQDYLTPAGRYYDDRDNFAKFEPGDGYEYSNTGSALMGVLVSEISGMDFNDYCKQRIFYPLGMHDTFWHLSETDTNMVVRPYEYKHGDYNPLQHYTFTDYPNGGLRSTPRNMFGFCSALANGGNFNGSVILQSSTVQEMLTLQVPDLDETQGLGLYMIHAGDNLWGHEGGEEGVSTIIAFNPADHAGTLIFTNTTDVDLQDLAVTAYRWARQL